MNNSINGKEPTMREAKLGEVEAVVTVGRLEARTIIAGSVLADILRSDDTRVGFKPASFDHRADAHEYVVVKHESVMGGNVTASPLNLTPEERAKLPRLGPASGESMGGFASVTAAPKIEAVGPIRFLEMEWKSGGTHPTPTWHLAINPEICVELRTAGVGASFVACGQVPERWFAKCSEAQFYCEDWLREKTAPLHAKRLLNALELAERAQDRSSEAIGMSERAGEANTRLRKELAEARALSIGKATLESVSTDFSGPEPLISATATMADGTPVVLRRLFRAKK